MKENSNFLIFQKKNIYFYFMNFFQVSRDRKWGCSYKKLLLQKEFQHIKGYKAIAECATKMWKKNCYYVREYLGDTSSYDAHLFFCFHDFRREFYMIWDHICLLIDMFELWNKFFLRIISSLQYLCKVEWYFHI